MKKSASISMTRVFAETYNKNLQEPEPFQLLQIIDSSAQPLRQDPKIEEEHKGL